MKLQVALDKVYGNEVIRPLCKQSRLLCQLAGKKTFTQESINICKELGYEFELHGIEPSFFAL